MAIPTPDQVGENDRSSDGYKALMTVLDKWFEAFPGLFEDRDGYREGSDYFSAPKWPNLADMTLATQALRSKGWEALIQDTHGYNPVIIWKVRPLRTAQRATVPVGSMRELPPRNAQSGSEPRLPPAEVTKAIAASSVAFPSPGETENSHNDPDAAAIVEADEYLTRLAKVIRFCVIRYESDGWAYIRDPSLPISFQKNTVQWQRFVATVEAAGWEPDIWTGVSHDSECTLMLRRRS